MISYVVKQYAVGTRALTHAHARSRTLTHTRAHCLQTVYLLGDAKCQSYSPHEGTKATEKAIQVCVDYIILY